MKILIANDDGIHAPGLYALVSAMTEAGHEVIVSAPDGQRSAASHSVTLQGPICVREDAVPGAVKAYAVSGTPADCVKLALTELVKDVDLVLSGINRGFNAGIDVLYSGTVAAAMEGAFFGRKAMAVSLGRDREDLYPAAAALAVKMVSRMEKMEIPPYSMLNLNYPETDQLQGIRVTGLRATKYKDGYHRKELPDGSWEYELYGYVDEPDAHDDDDYSWLTQGYATLTVLNFDMTEVRATDSLRTCDLLQND